MLSNLVINNATLEPLFNSEVTNYNVNLNSNDIVLDMEYEIDGDYQINIVGNDNLSEGDNIVLIELSNETELNTYTINVYKEAEPVINTIESIEQPLEIEKEMSSYIAPSIIGICILLILITFRIFFIRKKK